MTSPASGAGQGPASVAGLTPAVAGLSEGGSGGGALARPPESNADALGEQLAVVRRVAEQELGALGPLEVEVGRVLPGEADATVDLDVLGGRVEVRVGAVGLGQRGHDRQLVVVFGGGPTGVVGGGLGRL